MHFYCHNETTNFKLDTQKTTAKDVHFYINTTLACMPKEWTCKIFDKKDNKEYDISQLGKSEGNWEVYDSRPGRGDLKYYINVCRPLNKMDNGLCNGKLSFL